MKGEIITSRNATFHQLKLLWNYFEITIKTNLHNYMTVNCLELSYHMAVKCGRWEWNGSECVFVILHVIHFRYPPSRKFPWVHHLISPFLYRPKALANDWWRQKHGEPIGTSTDTIRKHSMMYAYKILRWWEEKCLKLLSGVVSHRKTLFFLSRLYG